MPNIPVETDLTHDKDLTQFPGEDIETILLTEKIKNALRRIYGSEPFYYADLYSKAIVNQGKFARNAARSTIEKEIKAQLHIICTNIREILQLNHLLKGINKKEEKAFFKYLDRAFYGYTIAEQPYIWGAIKSDMEKIYTLLVNYLFYYHITRNNIKQLITGHSYHIEREYDDPMLEKKLISRSEMVAKHIHSCTEDLQKNLFDKLVEFNNRKKNKTKKRKYKETDDVSGDEFHFEPIEPIDLDQAFNRASNSPVYQGIETETERGNYHYWLQQHDIADIARVVFHSYGEKTERGDRQFDIVSDIGAQLDIKFERFKAAMRQTKPERGRLTLIVNLENRHWVALVVEYRFSKFDAYYVDSISDRDKPLPEKIKRALNKAHIEVINLSILGQMDSFNCGLWALENANHINQMLDSDVLQEHWVEYYEKNIEKYNLKYFQARRWYYANLLRQDEERKNFISIFQMEDFPSIDSPTDCLMPRVKRSLNEICLFSWKDIDQFNEEKEEPRNRAQINIDSEKFIHYLSTVEDQDKYGQLVQLADFVEVSGPRKQGVQQLIGAQKVKQHFANLGNYARRLTQGLIYKDISAAFIRGDYNQVAVNLGFLGGGVITEQLAAKSIDLGEALILKDQFFLGYSLKMAAPFLRRGTSALIAYDLVQQVKMLQAGNQEALPGVIGDSIFISMDLATMGIEVLEISEIITGITSLAGPVGDSIGALVLLGTQIYTAVKKVEKMEQWIHLTGWQRFHEGLRIFFGLGPDTFLEEKVERESQLLAAYQRLLKQVLQGLQSHPDIKRYVVPTLRLEKKPDYFSDRSVICGGRLLGSCREKKHPMSIAVDLDNYVIFSRKNNEIYKRIPEPQLAAEGRLFCLPKSEEGSLAQPTYFCDKAIGLEELADKIGNYTVYALGKGKDSIWGFQESPNLFLVNEGFKKFYGGDQDDIFILQGQLIEGDLNGRGGIDTLMLNEFALEQSELTIYLNERVGGYLAHKGYQQTNLGLFHINKLIGRPGRGDTIYVQEGAFFIDAQGGTHTHPDKINISDAGQDLIHLNLVVRPNTEVINTALSGNFTYYIVSTEHVSDEQALFNFSVNKTVAQQHFFFNYTLFDIKAIDRINDTIKNEVAFHFLSKLSSQLTITLRNTPHHASYTFLDNMQLEIGKQVNLYAFQKTSRPVSEIIRDYLPLANRLKMSLIIHSSIHNETVMIGHDHHEVIHNDPLSSRSHLIGNKGENIYVIAASQSPLTLMHFPLPEVVLYNFSGDDATDTVDLRQITHSIIHTLGQKKQLTVTLDSQDILLQIDASIPEREERRSIMTIRLHQGIDWYTQVHFLFYRIPKCLIRHTNKWHLIPLPLIFDKEKHSVIITPRDIAIRNEIIIEQTIGYYEWLRDGQNLLITNRFKISSDKSNQCTLLLENFYENNKMHTLTIQFLDLRLRLEDEWPAINKANILERRLDQFINTTYYDVLNQAIPEQTVSMGTFDRPVRALDAPYQEHQSDHPNRANTTASRSIMPEALPLLSLALLKLTGRQFPRFKSKRSLSFAETHTYAAIIAEKIDCLVKVAAEQTGIRLEEKDDQLMWEFERALQEALRNSFIQGISMEKVISHYMNNRYLQQLSLSEKELILHVIQVNIELAPTHRSLPFKEKNLPYFNYSACFYKLPASNDERAMLDGLRESINNTLMTY